MPRNTKIKKVMVIGSGPIIIGQAAEFDYAGVQACRALHEEGVSIVLVNSNPATIMTDQVMADKIYIEPLTLPVIKRIIKKEKPDGILSGLGGQTALTLCMQLAKSGFLEKEGVLLLGSSPDVIDRAEDRQMFKDTMEEIGQPCIPSLVVTTVEDAVDFANQISYPVIVRPAFTLGGTGGGIAKDEKELREIAHNGIYLSPINQILVERCIAGWKEIEFEVMRDSNDNTITVCSMENFDPVGVHTGDSIVIAPTVTLSDKEYQMLRTAALSIISALKIEGGCNCQFALNPESFEYAVIEVNPRVSRSSALASKATGYPIAKVATKIALGYTLDEIKNAVTGTTYAAFEPAIDYVAVKFPKWPFDKFFYAKRSLGTQMKATGEVMAIDDSFEGALLKAVRGCEIHQNDLNFDIAKEMSTDDLLENIKTATDLRLFFIYELLKRDVSVDKIHELTMIDEWFLWKLVNIVNSEKDSDKNGSSDFTYKMVDTCAGEFEALTPYFYASQNTSAAGGVNEAAPDTTDNRKTVVVIGSGPIRIGQGIEFDYASVHCVMILRKLGYRVVIINNNPETVSTDFDIADRLYFEPLCPQDVLPILENEKPYGVVVAFGGQTAIKLAHTLDQHGYNLLGTSADAIDLAEDRERFEDLCEKLNINRPRGMTVFTKEEALAAAEKISYPVLIRPSYVLGGQNMIIAFDESEIHEYMDVILAQGIENPVLIDKYMMGVELEVDAICDGEDVLIPGIMEHIERTGIHSGDSIAVYPAWNLNDIIRNKIIKQSRELALALKTKGLVNIQYLIYQNDLYIIEVNPRSSRTVPYISKVTGVPMVDLAVRAMLGEKLKDMGFGTGLYRIPPYFAVKVPVFSFAKLVDVDTHLGPEMKSTGEVLGIASTMEEAVYKGFIAAGYNMKKSGGVLFTVRKTDQYEIPDLARKFYDMGFTLYATEGTAQTIRDFGMEVTVVNKIHENPDDNLLTLLDSGKIDYVISTSAKGRNPMADSVKMRRHAVERSIPCLTAIDTANALAASLLSKYTEENVELVDINSLRDVKQHLSFTKMESTGNDFIVINGIENPIENPNDLAVRLCERKQGGIGADSLVLIEAASLDESGKPVADARMRFFNLDGSEGQMAGNAIRCVGKYLYDKNINGLLDNNKEDATTVIHVETNAGVKELTLYKRNDKVTSVSVAMGKASFENKELVIDPIFGLKKTDSYNVTCVDIGNPHCVIFSQFVDKEEVSVIGPEIENHKMFPNRTNVEFVRVVNPAEIKMRAWERGNGETAACGTGACAAVVAACEKGLCTKDLDVTVKVKGGILSVRYTQDQVWLSGNAETCFEGVIEV
ncbi:MAG: carbamoyl-phosphate synthase large subunit [Treponema sp.]|nr:carbamoyl-phosphate synthase large subunit [Treponema sp.]